MKKILLTALIATALFSCSKENSEVPEGTNLKSLEFSLGIATPKTRMIDGSASDAGAIAEVRTNITAITIEYFNGSGTSLGTYDFSAEQISTVISDDQNGDRKVVKLQTIPSATSKVNVYLNVDKNATDINDLQIEYNKMEYRGETPVAITLKTDGAGAGTDGNDVYEVEVPVKPVMSRFEFTGSASDIIINSKNSGINLPNGINNGTKAQAQDLVSDATISRGEKAARDAWQAANPGTTLPTQWTYTYTVTYKYDPEYQITAIAGYYMNNIPLTKGATPTLNANNAIGDWDDTAKGNYSSNGGMKNMYDITAPATGNRIAYNLFPQKTSVENPTIANVKADMPHFILKLTTNEATPSTRWITIRALSTADGNNTLITSFEAGKVYILDAAQIMINQYSAYLTVTANGTTGPEIVEPKDPTDPNPEPTGKDLEVRVKILNWDAVLVKPEW